MPVFALSLFVVAVRADGLKRALFSRPFWQKLLSACLIPRWRSSHGSCASVM